MCLGRCAPARVASAGGRPPQLHRRPLPTPPPFTTCRAQESPTFLRVGAYTLGNAHGTDLCLTCDPTDTSDRATLVRRTLLLWARAHMHARICACTHARTCARPQVELFTDNGPRFRHNIKTMSELDVPGELLVTGDIGLRVRPHLTHLEVW